jgi:ligand-binding sensor domain-containing protein
MTHQDSSHLVRLSSSPNSYYLQQAFVVLVVLFSLLLAVPAVILAEQLPVKVYTTADGLAHNHVTRIFRDSRGLLWFCTLEGLSRFDGYRFTCYGREDGLPHADISDILEDRQGEYWVATYGGGVCRFTPSAISPPGKAHGRTSSRFIAYRVGEAPRHNLVNVLYQDNVARLWVGTDDGLFLFDSTHDHPGFRRVELVSTENPGSWEEVSALTEDREGNLWIGTAEGLVRRLPGGRTVQYTPRPPERVRSIRALLLDHEGRLWIGHGGGLIVLKPEPAASIASSERFSRRTLTARPMAAFLPDGRLNLPTEPGDATPTPRAME